MTPRTSSTRSSALQPERGQRLRRRRTSATIDGAPSDAEGAARHHGHRDAGRPDDRLQADQADWRDRRAGAGRCRSPLRCPRSTRGVRQEDPVDYDEPSRPSGPYMVENDVERRAHRYAAGQAAPTSSATRTGTRRRTTGRRTWTRSTSTEGTRRERRRPRRSLNGSHMVNGDIPPAPQVLKDGRAAERKDQLVVPDAGQPLRLAEHDAAAVRRPQRPQGGRSRPWTARRCARRAAASWSVRSPTHFLPPDVPGFEEAGGAEGLGLDFLSKPDRATRSCRPKYMKEAGYESGKYEGTDEGRDRRRANADPARPTADASPTSGRRSSASRHVNGRAAADDVLEVLRRPEGRGQRLPERRLVEGLQRPGAMLDPTFNGREIVPENNVN